MPIGYFRLRKIIPAAAKTQPCLTTAEARSRVLSLYRTTLRQSGEIQQLYSLNVPIMTIRQRVRQEFEKNRHFSQLAVINGLLLKGAMELEETLYMWKTDAQIMKYFDVDNVAHNGKVGGGSDGFLATFYASK